MQRREVQVDVRAQDQPRKLSALRFHAVERGGEGCDEFRFEQGEFFYDRILPAIEHAVHFGDPLERASHAALVSPGSRFGGLGRA